MNDIYIYEPIGDVRNYVEAVTQGATVHINSSGGDIFSAMALGNLVYRHNCEVIVEGLCASAATLIAACAKRTCAAANSVIMLHLPNVELLGSFNEQDLYDVQKSLATAKAAIIETYKRRIKTVDIEELLKNETWLSAEQSREIGLIDEIIPATEMRYGQKMSSQLEERYTASVRAAELRRIKDLQANKCGNAAINALIDCAVERGDSVAKVQPYLDVLKKIPVNASEAICKMIRDQMTSGSQNITGSHGAPDEREVYKQMVIGFANKGGLK